MHRLDSDLEARVVRPVGSLVVTRADLVKLAPETPAAELVRRCAEAGWQDVFPVLGAEQKMIGMIRADDVRQLAATPDALPLVVARELMRPAVFVRTTDDLRFAGALLLEHSLRELPVVDESGQLVGLIDEADIARVLLAPVV